MSFKNKVVLVGISPEIVGRCMGQFPEIDFEIADCGKGGVGIPFGTIAVVVNVDKYERDLRSESRNKGYDGDFVFATNDRNKIAEDRGSCVAFRDLVLALDKVIKKSLLAKQKSHQRTSGREMLTLSS